MQNHSILKMHVVVRWRANLIVLPLVLAPHLQNSIISEPILQHLLVISLSLLKFAAAQHLLLWTKSLAKPVYHTQKRLPFLVSTSFHCHRFTLSIDKPQSFEG